MRKTKKAVSPLIATVLLIAFAVALGAIVMNWGRGYVEDTQDFARRSSEGQLTCSSDVQMDFEFTDVDHNSTVDELNVTVRNDGGTDIYDLAIQVVTDDGKGGSYLIDDAFLELGNAADDENVNIAVLPQFRFLTFVMDNDDLGLDNDEIGDIVQIKLIPRINAGSDGENIACSSQAVTIDNFDGEWQYDDQS